MKHIFLKNGGEAYLIAEIGGNHEGDFGYAKKLAKSAILSGADCVKFQVYTGEKLVNAYVDSARAKHFNRFMLTVTQHRYLADMCLESGLDYCASFWDEASLLSLDEKVKFYKIGSGDLTNYSLLKSMMVREKPIILSTGLSTLSEVRRTVEFIEESHNFYQEYENLSIMQCTSMYPIPNSDANLNVIKVFRENFNHPIGYSDHTIGAKAIILAVALGAQVIEFHFTDDKSRTFRDHSVSLTKQDVFELRNELEAQNILLGSDEKRPTESEVAANHIFSFRRAVFLTCDLKQGDVIQKKHLTALRPQKGIPANMFYELIGKKLTRDVSKLEPLDITYFE